MNKRNLLTKINDDFKILDFEIYRVNKISNELYAVLNIIIVRLAKNIDLAFNNKFFGKYKCNTYNERLGSLRKTMDAIAS